ncbi:histidine phosphatase family protein [Clostridium sp. LIBA-8841]|uniref:histidine phosphatase family protein n=1 Tax=Clostridium sp. LIBA-8841 TaxID=2987530 RepID=UPI002AC6CB84|nr:histidine phosphatase family protein [Clostridium sp. LIBA-8841]MDZ5253349.1 histidine phosphatase family protein [Clostridium sp. LIBA-8841]
MIIYLIRHGKTYCNEKKLYCGISDVPLSEIGISELEEKRKSVKLPECKRNFTSGAKRANETFNILYPNEKYEVVKEFGEYNFGEFELKSYEMLKEDKKYLDWILDESKGVSCPNGESRRDFEKRMKKAFLKLLLMLEEQGEEEALIVCHGGSIACILELFEKEGLDFYTYQPKCGGGYKLKVEQDIENLEKEFSSLDFEENIENNLRLEIIERF